MIQFVIVFMLITATAFAAPTKPTVTGTISNGSAITISGTSFGSGPNVILFDDLEGTAGNPIPLSSPNVGVWSGSNGTPVYNSNHYSGSTGFLIYNESIEIMRQLTKTFGDQTEIFMSYMVRIPNGTNFPGDATEPATFSTNSAWKYTWLADNSGWPAGDGLWDMCIPTWAGGTFLIAGNSGGNFKYPGTAWWSWTSWMNISFWSKGTRASGGESSWETLSSENGYSKTSWSTPVFTSSYVDNDRFDQIVFPGWIRSYSTTSPVYDDIYVAVGEHAAARVVLTDSSTFSSSTKIAMCTPSSWSSTSITAICWEGGFDNNDTVYLYVIDDQNDSSPASDAKTFSGGGTPTPVISVTSAPDSIAEENSGTANFVISCSDCVGGEGVSFTLGGTATGSGTDYTSSGSSPISSFPANVTITAVDDSEVESPSEYVTLTLSSPTGGALLGTSAATITINDNDSAPTCSDIAQVTIFSDIFNVGFTTDETAVECKWRIGAAPDESNGTVTDTTSYALGVSGFSYGDNSLYVGCRNSSNEWASHSIPIYYAADVVYGPAKMMNVIMNNGYLSN